MDLNAWLLFARSGERRYYDYGRHFTRFGGDLGVHHWTADNRFRGGFADADVHLPFYWHGGSKLSGPLWTPGWLLEYRLTGDEYANELLRMVAEAYHRRVDLDKALRGYMHHHVVNTSTLYEHTRDEKLRKIAREAAYTLMDLDNPIGLNDDLRYGVYYKTSTEWLLPLYLYYNATGDETARKVILRAIDDKFRFFYSSNQTVRLHHFAEAYNWTGNRSYLRLINLMVQKPIFSLMGHNYFLGAPTALHAIANADRPIDPFPVLAAIRMPDIGNMNEDSVVRSNFIGVPMDHEVVEGDVLPPIRVKKKANMPATLSIYVRTANEVDENAEPVVRVVKRDPTGGSVDVDNVQIENEQRYTSRNAGRNRPRRWHVYVTLPAEAEAGTYRMEFPDAAAVIVLESDTEDVRLERGG